MYTFLSGRNQYHLWPVCGVDVEEDDSDVSFILLLVLPVDFFPVSVYSCIFLEEHSASIRSSCSLHFIQGTTSTCVSDLINLSKAGFDSRNNIIRP